VKAVVLAAGKGTRMRAASSDESLEAALTREQRRAADAGMKSMVPFRGRPFLDYVLSALADAGCTEVCLIVSPGHGGLRDYYTRLAPPRRVRLNFAVQHEARGTADALLAAEPFAREDPFIALNSDNYYPAAALRDLVAIERPGLLAFSTHALVRNSNVDANRVRDFAVTLLTPEGDLADIIEKPNERTFDALAQSGDVRVSMNVWRFDGGIFEACRRIEPSPRGELELPNAVRYAIRTLGRRFSAVPVDAGVLDLSRRADIPAVGRWLAGVDANP
jgi:glucose-1-phosphate thymidylyltransferase